MSSELPGSEGPRQSWSLSPLWPGHNSELHISCLPEQLLFSRTCLGRGGGFSAQCSSCSSSEVWEQSPRYRLGLRDGQPALQDQEDCGATSYQVTNLHQDKYWNVQGSTARHQPVPRPGRGDQAPAGAVLGPSLCCQNLLGWTGQQQRPGLVVAESSSAVSQHVRLSKVTPISAKHFCRHQIF